MLRGSLGVLVVCLLVACSGADSSTSSGGGGSGATGGSGGTSAAGGSGGTSAAGGSGGTSATGGSGGTSATGGSGGTSASGGSGGTATGGAAGAGGSATGGAAGSGGTAGAAGSSGGTGATGGSGGTGGGQACTWGSSTCPNGQYCEAPGCGAGTCVNVPAETNNKSAVCGCDGVTYWNASVAAHNSMSVKGTGACTTGAKTCGGIAGLKCPTGTFCSYNVSGSNMCNVSDIAGSCWGMPATCPTILIGPSTRACKATTCSPECQLIKAGSTWYTDNTCPV